MARAHAWSSFERVFAFHLETDTSGDFPTASHIRSVLDTKRDAP